VARLPNTATKEERIELHRAKMAGKVIDRQRLVAQRTAIEYKFQARRLIGLGSIAQINRHTGKPHENAREIMRREMTPLQRRAFTAAAGAYYEAAFEARAERELELAA
jgi:ABC-type hemin transport system ATPase subunit